MLIIQFYYLNIFIAVLELGESGVLSDNLIFSMFHELLLCYNGF